MRRKALVQLSRATLKQRGATMVENEQDYTESEQEREEGHVNTRCPDCCTEHDPNLGCDLGIDEAG